MKQIIVPYRFSDMKFIDFSDYSKKTIFQFAT